MKLFNKSKRGNWVDIAQFMGEALGIGVLLLITLVLLANFNDLMISNAATTPIMNDSIALGYSQDITDKFPAATDFILPLIYVFILGFTIWSARKVESSHKFFFIMIIATIVLFLFAMGIETFWQEFTTNVTIASYISSYPITHFMLSNLRMFILVMSTITGIALYAKEK